MDNQTYSDPSTWQSVSFNPFTDLEGNGGSTYYLDPTSGNLFGSQDATSPLLTKEALDFSKSLSNVSVPNMVNMGDSGMQQSGMKNQYFLGEDPTQIAKDYSLYQSNPHAFNAQTAQNLSNSLFSTWAQNGNNLGSPFGFDPTSQQQDKLNAFKQTDPQAYYNAVLSQKAKEIGWDAGQNKTNQDNNAQFQNLAREAMAAGLSSDDINNIFNSNYQNTAKMNAENISSRAGQGATLQGIEKALPAMAALATAGFLAPEAAALDAASTASTVAPEIAGNGFYTGTGFGAGEGLGTTGGINFSATGGSNGLINSGAGGAFSPSGAMATQSAAGLGGAGTGIIEGLVPSSIGMAGTAGAGSLAGIAGTEALAGLGGANLGYGLTADQLAQYEAGGSNLNGTSLNNILKNANTALKGINTASQLAKLLGVSGSQASNAIQNLAAGKSGTGMAIPALLRGNQNPFFQTQQQPIRSQSDLASLASLLKQG